MKQKLGDFLSSRHATAAGIILLGAFWSVGAYFLATYLFDRYVYTYIDAYVPAVRDRSIGLEAQLASLGEAYVFFNYENLNARGTNDNGLRLTLVAQSTSASTTMALFSFPIVGENLHYPGTHISYYQGDFYYISGTGALMRLSDLTTAEPLAIGLKEGEEVSSYLFDGGRLFYLAGPFCNMYMGKCDGTLREVMLSTGAVRDIASHIPHNTIAGLSGDRQSLFVQKDFGDAGCFSTRISRIALASGEMEERPVIGACAGDIPDEEFESLVAEARGFSATLQPKRVKADHLLWTGSAFVVPASSEPRLSEYSWNIEVYE